MFNRGERNLFHQSEIWWDLCRCIFDCLCPLHCPRLINVFIEGTRKINVRIRCNLIWSRSLGSQSPPDNSSRFGYLVQTDQRVRNIRPSLDLYPWSSLTSQPLSSIYQGGDLILDEAQRCGVFFNYVLWWSMHLERK